MTRIDVAATAKYRRTLFGLHLSILLIAALASAQESYEEVISVVEVEIPVRVLRNGAPVPDLGKENFRVYDRGRERPIIGFRLVDLRGTAVSARPELGATSIESVAPSSERFFLAVIDTVNTERTRLARTVEDLGRGFADKLQPTDRAAVAILNSRGPLLLLGFTANAEALAAAFDLVRADLGGDAEARQRAAAVLAEHRASSLAEMADLVGPSAALALAEPEKLEVGRSPTINIDISPVLDAEGAASGRFASGIEEAFELGEILALNVTADQAGSMTSSLRDLATLLRRIRGQKHLILLSGGIYRFDELVTSGNQAEGKWVGTGTQIARDIRELTETFQRTGWQIDVLGASTPGELDASLLGTLAAETGGDLFENFNRQDDAFARVVEMSEVSYWLTFQCDDLWADDTFRRLRVEVVDAEGRVAVKARKGYYGQAATRPETDLESRLNDSEDLLYGPDRQDFPLELTTLVSPTADGRVRISLLARGGPGIPGDRDAELINLSIQAVARKPGQGATDDLLSEFVQLDASELRAALEARRLQFLGDLVVSPGTYEVRFRLANRDTGRAHLRTSTVEAPGTGWRQPIPMVLESGQGPVLLRERSTELTLDAWSPFIADTRFFLPASLPMFVAGQAVPIHVKLFGRWTEGSDLQLRLRGEADDTLVPVAVEVHSTTGLENGQDQASVLASFELPQVPAGRYDLEVVWEDGVTEPTEGRWPIRVGGSATR